MLHRIKQITTAFIILLLLTGSSAYAQKGGAIIGSDTQTHDFGVIAEADGFATHSFTIKNTGSTALVINRITASCGCTQPEWAKTPIAPGSAGEVKVSYNPKGRPGPFYKSITIHSNAGNERLTLYIKGTVKSRTVPEQPAITYPYSIGNLKLQTKTIQYSRIYPGETLEETIRIKNEGKTPLSIYPARMPDHLTVEISPDTLKPEETGEISVLFHTDKVRRMGRVSSILPFSVESAGEKKTEGSIHVAANLINNFSRLSASEKAKAPVAQFSLTLLDFGKMPEKSGGIISFIGIGGKESESLVITNTGQSPLLIYSVACDNELVDISGGRKELKPGASSTYKVSIRPKEIKARLEAFIHVVCNDPGGPVRLIKVTAEK
jgi:archaellum component FlaG (FlaF/FlaG flagellin family)